MAAETIDGVPITVTVDNFREAQRIALALQHLVARDVREPATILTATGERVEVAPFLIAALQQMTALLARGDDVAIVPVHKDVSLVEAAALLDVSLPALIQSLETGAVLSTGTGNERRIGLHDLVAYKEQRSADSRRDLATALAVVQEAGAYD